MSEPVTLRTILQGRLQDLDERLTKLEAQAMGAKTAFETERAAAEQKLQLLGNRWRAANERFTKVRDEREAVFQALQAEAS